MSFPARSACVTASKPGSNAAGGPHFAKPSLIVRRRPSAPQRAFRGHDHSDWANGDNSANCRRVLPARPDTATGGGLPPRRRPSHFAAAPAARRNPLAAGPAAAVGGDAATADMAHPCRGPSRLWQPRRGRFSFRRRRSCRRGRAQPVAAGSASAVIVRAATAPAAWGNPLAAGSASAVGVRTAAAEHNRVAAVQLPPSAFVPPRPTGAAPPRPSPPAATPSRPSSFRRRRSCRRGRLAQPRRGPCRLRQPRRGRVASAVSFVPPRPSAPPAVVRPRPAQPPAAVAPRPPVTSGQAPVARPSAPPRPGQGPGGGRGERRYII